MRQNAELRGNGLKNAENIFTATEDNSQLCIITHT